MLHTLESLSRQPQARSSTPLRPPRQLSLRQQNRSQRLHTLRHVQHHLLRQPECSLSAARSSGINPSQSALVLSSLASLSLQHAAAFRSLRAPVRSPLLWLARHLRPYILLLLLLRQHWQIPVAVPITAFAVNDLVVALYKPKMQVEEEWWTKCRLMAACQFALLRALATEGQTMQGGEFSMLIVFMLLLLTCISVPALASTYTRTLPRASGSVISSPIISTTHHRRKVLQVLGPRISLRVVPRNDGCGPSPSVAVVCHTKWSSYAVQHGQHQAISCTFSLASSLQSDLTSTSQDRSSNMLRPPDTYQMQETWVARTWHTRT